MFKGKGPLKLLSITPMLCGLLLFAPSIAFAYEEDAGEHDQAIDVKEALAEPVAKSPAVNILQTREAKMPQPELPEKAFVKEVVITGVNLIDEEDLEGLQDEYSGRELTARQMQRIADLINRAYSREGYISSYAYVVPDRLPDGILEVTAVEGMTGKIVIEGNEHFTKELLEEKLTLKEGEPFNFQQLNKDVYRINRSPDRKLAIELVPDEVTGATNVVLKVKDRSPVHVTLQADNYGSETILKQRYKTFVAHNNLTGHDDVLTAKIEWAQADAHKIFDLDYNVPLNNDWRFQLYVLPYKSEDYYYKDNELNDFEKRARKFYFWFHQYLINVPKTEFISSYGFTYFDILWYQPYRHYDQYVKKDAFRVLKWDLSLNKQDDHGRWIITNDLQKAIPDIFGGTPEKSDTTSVVGAKGDYIKDMLTIARRQKLVAGIDFTAKARAQWSSATLTGVNAFSIGGYCGVIDNRGYPRTQLPADAGRALNLGLEFPAYFIPRTVNAPFANKTKLYDALRWFTFYDWGQGILKSPKAGQNKKTTLTSVGFGFLYNVPEQSLSMRLDVGFPLSDDVVSIDSDHTQGFWSVTKGF